MGKYIEKGKRKIEAVEEEAMEVSPSPLGVRTRAKTKSLAIQRLQKAKSKSKSKSKPAKASPSSSAASSSSAKSESCYLQLRSRRLEKSFATKVPMAASPKAGATKEEVEEENDAGIEVSFGENVLEAEGAGSRNSRETTPCSLIKRDSETIGTPGSTNRPTSSTANNRTQSLTPRNVPYTREMEEFFAEPEERQQKEFAEKYNFDPVKDSPLPGRYEWIKLKN